MKNYFYLFTMLGRFKFFFHLCSGNKRTVDSTMFQCMMHKCDPLGGSKIDSAKKAEMLFVNHR